MPSIASFISASLFYLNIWSHITHFLIFCSRSDPGLPGDCLLSLGLHIRKRSITDVCFRLELGETVRGDSFIGMPSRWVGKRAVRSMALDTKLARLPAIVDELAHLVRASCGKLASYGNSAV